MIRLICVCIASLASLLFCFYKPVWCYPVIDNVDHLRKSEVADPKYEQIFGLENVNHVPKTRKELENALDSETTAQILNPYEIAEGDIKINEFYTKIKEAMASNTSVRDVIIYPQYQWKTRNIPYEFDPSLDQIRRDAFESAVVDFKTYTCVNFIPRTVETDYIRVFYGSGCYSYIGHIGGAQDLSLGYGCQYKGTAIHEMMHALGFFHEHTRLDRNDYVTINYENIIGGTKSNFDQYEKGIADYYGVGYDYLSVMHYGKKAFSKNNEDTISVKDPSVTIGQRFGFSEIDIKQINNVFQCNQVIPTTATSSITTLPTTQTSTEAAIQSTAQKTAAPLTQTLIQSTTPATTQPTTLSTTQSTTLSTTQPTTPSPTQLTTLSTTQPPIPSTMQPKTLATTQSTTLSTTQPTTPSTTQQLTLSLSTTQPPTPSTMQPKTLATTQSTTPPATQPTTLSTTQPPTPSTMQPTTLATTQSITLSTTQPATPSTTQQSTLSTTQPPTPSTMQPKTLATTQSTTPPATQPTTLSTTQPPTPSTMQPTTLATTQSITLSTTQPKTPSTTQQSTLSTTQPPTPSTVQPTTLSTTQSTTLSTTQPTTPSTTQPTTLSTTQSTTLSTTQPTTPSTTQPTTLSTTQSTTPFTTQPTTLSTTQPPIPSTMQPTTLATTQPPTPSTVQPTTPSTTQPTTLSTTQSTTLSTTQPTTLSTTQSTTLSTTQPTTPSTTQPTTLSATQPPTPSTMQPTTLPTTQPTTLATTQPPTHSTTQSTTLSTTQPTTLSTPQPTTPSTTQPTTMSATQPPTPSTMQPATLATTQSTTLSTTQPTTPYTTQQSTLSTTQQPTPSTMQPTTLATTNLTTSSNMHPTTLATTQPTTLSTTQPTTLATTQPTTLATTQPKKPSTRQPTTLATTETTTTPAVTLMPPKSPLTTTTTTISLASIFTMPSTSTTTTNQTKTNQTEIKKEIKTLSTNITSNVTSTVTTSVSTAIPAVTFIDRKETVTSIPTQTVPTSKESLTKTTSTIATITQLLKVLPPMPVAILRKIKFSKENKFTTVGTEIIPTVVTTSTSAELTTNNSISKSREGATIPTTIIYTTKPESLHTNYHLKLSITTKPIHSLIYTKPPPKPIVSSILVTKSPNFLTPDKFPNVLGSSTSLTDSQNPPTASLLSEKEIRTKPTPKATTPFLHKIVTFLPKTPETMTTENPTIEITNKTSVWNNSQLSVPTKGIVQSTKATSNTNGYQVLSRKQKLKINFMSKFRMNDNDQSINVDGNSCSYGKDFPCWPEDFKIHMNTKERTCNCAKDNNECNCECFSKDQQWNSLTLCYRKTKFNPLFQWSSEDKPWLRCSRLYIKKTSYITTTNYLCHSRQSPYNLRTEDNENGQNKRCLQFPSVYGDLANGGNICSTAQ